MQRQTAMIHSGIATKMKMISAQKDIPRCQHICNSSQCKHEYYTWHVRICQNLLTLMFRALCVWSVWLREAKCALTGDALSAAIWEITRRSVARDSCKAWPSKFICFFCKKNVHMKKMPCIWQNSHWVIRVEQSTDPPDVQKENRGTLSISTDAKVRKCSCQRMCHKGCNSQGCNVALSGKCDLHLEFDRLGSVWLRTPCFQFLRAVAGEYAARVATCKK